MSKKVEEKKVEEKKVEAKEVEAKEVEAKEVEVKSTYLCLSPLATPKGDIRGKVELSKKDIEELKLTKALELGFLKKI